jgi:TP901 family phage tail tape measure protein
MDDITSLQIKVDSTQVKTSTSALNDLGKAGENAEKGVKKVDSASGAMAKSLHAAKIAAVGIAAGITAISAAILTMSVKAVKDFAAYEKGLIGVQKTTDFTAKEMVKFQSAIQAISRELPIATVELLGIAQAAGQLGVKGVENVSRFTEVMAKLQLSTDVVGEEGAKQIARLLTITGEGIGVIDNFGAVLVALGNNAAASESEILWLGSEIGQATSTFRLSANEVIGLAAGMRELGVRAELGGSVVARAMREIEGAINTGGESMRLLSTMTGIAGNDLKKTFQDDAVGVFQAWLKGMGGMIKSGATAVEVLDEFGLKGEEVLKVLPTMAMNYDTIAKSMNLMSEEQEKGTALNIEAAKAAAGLDAQFGIFKNLVNEISISIGASLAPRIKEVLGQLRDWWDANSEIVKQDMAVVFSAVADAIGAIGTALHSVISGMNQLTLTREKNLNKHKVLELREEMGGLNEDLYRLKEGWFGVGKGSAEEIAKTEAAVKELMTQIEALENGTKKTEGAIASTGEAATGTYTKMEKAAQEALIAQEKERLAMEQNLLIQLRKQQEEEESAIVAEKAAEEYANFYQSTLDRLLPLVKEQKDYNAALAVLKDMDPSQSTEAYRTALDNLEKSLTVNIEKAKELAIERERLAENIQLGSTGPDELRNAAAPEQVRQQNELLRLQNEYNEAVDKQVAIQRELGAAYGLSAQEAEKLKKAFASEQIMKEVDSLQYLTTFSGQSFGNEIADGVNRAALSVSKMNTMFEEQLKLQDEIKKKREAITKSTELDANQRKKGLKELDDLESAMLSDQLSGYSNLFGTIGQLFDENSKERKTMHTLEMAFAAAEIAINVQKALTNAVVAITNQGSGDPYTAFARIAAMVAIMGGIVGMIGGSLSGGGSSGKQSSSATTGTVFGDPSASSESLKNATDILSEFEEKQYSELRAIHREMTALNSNITGLVTGLIRSVGGEFNGMTLSNTVNETVKKFSMMLDPLTTWLLGDSSVAKWLWGSKKVSVTGTGIDVAPTTVGSLLGGGDASVRMYQDIETKKKGMFGGLFGGNSTKNSTTYTQADEDVTRLFTQVFSGMSKTLVELTEGLGANLSTALSYAFTIPKLNLMGKNGEEITEAVQAAISTAFDNAASAVLGGLVEKYQQVSEGMFETAVRVYTNQVVVMDALGRTGNATYGNILDLTQAIVGLAGGTNEFVATFENYIELFTTENEKLAKSLDFTVKSIADLGLVFPTTRQGFSDLVSSLDVTTESGQRAYVALLSLADSADHLYSAIEEVMESINDTLAKLGMSDAEKSLYNLTKQYDEYIETLKASGAALSDISKVERARTGLLKEAAGDLLATIKNQVEEYANAVKIAEDNIQSAYSNAVSKRDAAQEKVNSLLERSSVNLESFSKSIDSFLNSLDLQTLESNFDNLKAQFMITASAAAGGDSTAQNNLLAQANSVLAAAESNSTDKLEYDKIVALVRSQVSMVQGSISPGINTDIADAQLELAEATSELAQFEVLAIKAGVTLETSADKTAKLLAELDDAYQEAFLNNVDAQRQYQIALSLTNGLTFETATALSELISNVNALRSTMSAYANSFGNANNSYSSTSFDPANIMYLTAQLGSMFDIMAEIERYKSQINNQISGSFAVGTDYVPYDMTANIHQGERIVPAAYNRSDKTNAELVAEIQALRKEMNAVMYQVAKNTLKTADYAERQDGTVMKVAVVEEIPAYQREAQVVGNTIGSETGDSTILLEDGTVATQEDGSYWGQEG